MSHKFCGLDQEQMYQRLLYLCDMEDRFALTKEEIDTFDLAIQCVTAIMNRMKDDKPISWDG